MTEKPEIDFPDGPPPADLEIIDIAVGDGAEATPGQPGAACTTSAWPTAPARSSTPATTVARRWTSRSAPAGSSRAGTPGVAGMKVGGRRQLTIPPHLAYGDRGAGGVIKPGETLIFVVDLVDVSLDRLVRSLAPGPHQLPPPPPPPPPPEKPPPLNELPPPKPVPLLPADGTGVAARGQAAGEERRC